MNGYYTRAQQARASRLREGDSGYGALEDFRLRVDDHWWMANVLLFHADALNSRYRLNLQVPSPFAPPVAHGHIDACLVAGIAPWIPVW